MYSSRNYQLQEMDLESVANSAVEAVLEEDLGALETIANAIPKTKISEVLSLSNTNGRSPLNEAISKKNVKIMRFLLGECHVDPMEINKPGSKLLCKAVINKEFEMVKTLIEYGASINSFDDCHFSPLHLACTGRYVEIALYLIDKGGDIDKSRCLITAIRSTNNEFIIQLLECGADVNIKGEDGDTPLHACCRQDNLEIFKILIEKGAMNCNNDEGMSQLQMAALGGYPDIFAFYSTNSVHTRDEVLDCVELQGIHSLLENDLTSCLQFWNTVLKERCQSKRSKLLVNFQHNWIQMQTYDHWIGDTENASIHSIIILERIFGIQPWIVERYFQRLLRLISIMRAEFWEEIISYYWDAPHNALLRECKYTYAHKCKNYVKNRLSSYINSSVVKVAINFINLRSDSSTTVEKYPHFRFIDNSGILLIVCLNYMKEKVVDFNIKEFDATLKHFLKSRCYSSHHVLHTLIKFSETWDLPGRLMEETFEMICKLSEASLNHLDDENKTPLYEALNGRNENENFIDLLLNNGALIDPEIRNINGISIRELAYWRQRENICVGTSSFQASINKKMKQNKKYYRVSGYIVRKPFFRLKIDAPPILLHFIEIH